MKVIKLTNLEQFHLVSALSWKPNQYVNYQGVNLIYTNEGEVSVPTERGAMRAKKINLTESRARALSILGVDKRLTLFQSKAAYAAQLQGFELNLRKAKTEFDKNFYTSEVGRVKNTLIEIELKLEEQ